MTLIERLPIPTLLHATRQSLYTAMSRSVAAAGCSVAQQRGRSLIPKTHPRDRGTSVGHGARRHGAAIPSQRRRLLSLSPAQQHHPQGSMLLEGARADSTCQPSPPHPSSTPVAGAQQRCWAASTPWRLPACSQALHLGRLNQRVVLRQQLPPGCLVVVIALVRLSIPTPTREQAPQPRRPDIAAGSTPGLTAT